MANGINSLTFSKWPFLAFLFVSASLTSIWQSNAIAADTIYYKEDLITLQTGILGFLTSGNYINEENIYQRLPNGGKLATTDILVGTRWTPSSRWGLFLGFDYGAAESNDGNYIRTNNGFAYSNIGVDYRVMKERFDLISEFTFFNPSTRISPATDSAIFCEGDRGIQLRLIAQKKGLLFRNQFWAGFRSRDEGRSSLVPWGVSTEYQKTNLMFGAEVQGRASVGYDKYSDTPNTRNDVTKLVNASSYRYWSVNPSSIETNLWLAYDFSTGYNIKFGGGTTLTGRNAAVGNSLFMVLTAFSLPEKTSPQQKLEFKTDIERTSADKFFVPPPAESILTPAHPVKPLTPEQQHFRNQLDEIEADIENQRRH